MSTDLPSHLLYTVDHEWIDTTAQPARVGLTSVATDALGDIVFIELPEVGASVTASTACGVVESTKSVSDIMAPASGTVVGTNRKAVDDPAIINADPFGDGWLFALEVSEVHDLIAVEEYLAMMGGL